MADPIEKLQETETFKKLDDKLNWSIVTIFGTVGVLILVAFIENTVLA